MDKITLSGIACGVRVGVTAEERTASQQILFDLELAVDIAKAGATDDLKDTVDYQALETIVRAEAEKTEYRLVERLAERAAALVLSADPRISSVLVTARKKPATMPRTAEVAVTLSRSREKTPGPR